MSARSHFILFVCIPLLPALCAAQGFEVFSYERDGAMRLCKGDTRTGDAECVTGTGQAITTAGQMPQFQGTTEAEVTWLKFPARFTGPAAEGQYAFFVYYQAEEARICTGNTATSEVICADGTGLFARTRGLTKPVFAMDGDRKIRLYRFFGPQPGKVGDFGFSAYRQNKAARVCWFRTANGEAVCTSGTSVFSREPAMSPPRWQMKPAQTTWYRYFGPLR